MSGFDQGAHIVELHQHDQARRLRARQSRVRLRQGRSICKRMGEANFPYLRRQHARGRRLADPRHEGLARSSRSAGQGRRRRPRACDARRRCRSPGDLKFANELETLRAAGRQAAPGRAPTSSSPSPTPTATMDNAIVRSRLVDVLLTGHDHDLAIGYRRQDRDGRDQRGGQLRHRDRLRRHGDAARARTARSSGRRASASTTRATVDPDPEVAAVVKGYEDELSQGTRRRDRHHARSSSTAARPSCARRRRRSATSSPTRCGPRPGPTSPSPMAAASAPTSSIRPAHKLTRRDILSELPFGNTTVMVEITGADIRAALENGVSQIENRRRPLPAGLGPQVRGRPRGAGRARASSSVTVDGAAARSGGKATRSPPTTSCWRAATATPRSARARC